MPRSRRERIALGLWGILALFVGNGIYDVMMARGIKEFLLRYALSEAGAGPAVPLAPLMHTTAWHAAAVGVLWASLVLMAGCATIALVRPQTPV